MDELVRQIQFLKTVPGAVDPILDELRKLYQAGDLQGMVKALNARKYQTGREYQVTQIGYTGPLTVTWEAR